MFGFKDGFPKKVSESSRLSLIELCNECTLKKHSCCTFHKFLETHVHSFNMDVSIVGLVLLTVLTVFHKDCVQSCSIQISRKSCYILPHFENCPPEFSSAPLHLLTIFTDAGTNDSITPVLNFVATHRFTFALNFNQLERSVELQALPKNCCFKQTAEPFLTILFSYNFEDKCAGYLLEKSKQKFRCGFPPFALLNILILDDLILIRGIKYGFWLKSEKFKLQLWRKFSLLENLLTFAMWIDENITVVPFSNSCNCAPLQHFNEFYKECTHYPEQMMEPPIMADDNTDNNQSITTEKSENWKISKSKIAGAVICAVIVILLAMILKDMGFFQRNNRVYP